MHPYLFQGVMVLHPLLRMRYNVSTLYVCMRLDHKHYVTLRILLDELGETRKVPSV
jgi:hypothetical protein